MAASPRFSIGFLTAIVICVAADFAFIRANWEDPGPQVEVGLAILPMVNVLMLASPSVRVNGVTRPNWLGFEVAGWALVVVAGASVWSHPTAFLGALSSVVRMTRGMNKDVASGFIILYGMIRFLAPQFVLALFGGWLLARWRPLVDRA